jgi:hypothetical protein
MTGSEAECRRVVKAMYIAMLGATDSIAAEMLRKALIGDEVGLSPEARREAAPAWHPCFPRSATPEMGRAMMVALHFAMIAGQ